MRRAVVEGVVYREGIIGAGSPHFIEWDGTQAHGWNMTSYENFMNRFFADLAIHSPGQEIHYKPAQLEQTYHVPEIDIRECLPQWAHQGLIQLRAWDGHTSRHWNEWPDLDRTFMPAKDGMYLLTGSSSAILPRSTSIIAATLVIVLVTEWIGKMAFAVIGVPFSTSRLPKHLK